MWFATLVGCRIDIIKAQATEKRGNDMLHTLEKGEYPKALQYIMGHKDIKMTLGYYAHMDGCTAAEEMRRVAA